MLLRRLVTTAAAGVAACLLAAPALASGPATTLGHDVSSPQCGSDLPATGSFGIVGVNAGSGRTSNPCLADQAAWAQGQAYAPALYVNAANPGQASPIWPTTSSGPVRCTTPSSFDDYGCV